MAIAIGVGALVGGAAALFTPILPAGIVGGMLAGGATGLASNMAGQTVGILSSGSSANSFSAPSAITSMLIGGIGGGIGASMRVPAMAGMIATNATTGVVDAGRSKISESIVGSGPNAGSSNNGCGC